MEVQDILDPAELNLLNIIVKVLATKLPNVLLFLYKSPNGEYNFVSLIPEGASIDKEFIKKFNELASNFADSMAVIPMDDCHARMFKLINSWRIKGAQGTIEKLDNGNVNIKFN